MKYKIRKQNGNQNTQLVDRHNDTCQTILQRTVIAQPGSTGGKSGQADKAKFPVIDCAHTVLLFRDNAVRMASETPARIMGVYDRKGSLQKGKDADILVLDEDLNVRAVWAMGKLVPETNTLF